MAMACMGIATGDFDGNQLIDLFVTNFRDEANTLYLQDSPGLFTDATHTSGLTAPGLPYVGWGTQCLDADLDGDLDLVVVNGDVDDFRSRGGMFHMPPHLYLNNGHGQFVLSDPELSGSFFESQYLGRGLARLDWNRDGRTDFAVSNMNSQASLATNHTPDTGHFFNIRLTATTTSRDAVGTKIRLRSGSLTTSTQLVAGDGFMASNERTLQFGLGQEQTVDELTVTWPSGRVTVLRDLPVNATLEIVEWGWSGSLWKDGQTSSLVLRPTP